LVGLAKTEVAANRLLVEHTMLRRHGVCFGGKERLRYVKEKDQDLFHLLH